MHIRRLLTPAPLREPPRSYDPVDLAQFESAQALEALGAEHLKAELARVGLKCGGTLPERAERLFMLKNTPLDKLPKKLLAAPRK